MGKKWLSIPSTGMASLAFAFSHSELAHAHALGQARIPLCWQSSLNWEPPMNYWYFASGTLLLLFTLTDLVLTTFAPTGSGVITGSIRRWIWRLFLWTSGRKATSKILNYAGPITVVAWLFGWLVLIWLGNSLIFLSDPDSVVSSQNFRSTTWAEKFYFTGYTLSTLGSGEFIPYSTGWQLYSAFISFSGFILITISLTYLYSVVSSDISRKKVSIRIYHTGSTPQEILLRYWNGQDFNRLKEDLTSLSEEILQVAQNHMAYPVLHNFHSSRRSESFSTNIACLDEALTILLLYKPPGVAPSLSELYRLRSAITHYLLTLRNAFIKPSADAPPAPKLDVLRTQGLPIRQEKFEHLLNENLLLRRKLLMGLVRSQGWSWSIFEQAAEHEAIDSWLSLMKHRRD